MIPINLLIDRIQAKLDTVSVPSHIDNTVYAFKVFANEGEYERSRRDGNTVTKYINCVASMIGDEKTGINEATMTVSATIKLDILIPDATIEYENITFGNAVINAINSVFMLPTSDQTEADGMIYNIVGLYSTVTPGLKEIRPVVGESLTATAYIDYIISTSGYSSDKVKLYITPSPTLVNPNPERTQIFYSRLDISRTTTQESNVQSNNSMGVSKSVDVSTALVVSIVKPDRIDYLDRQITSYLLNGNRPKLTITLGWPHKVLDNLEPSEYTSEFTMTFREACKGAQGLDIPANTCTLAELLEV